MSRSGTRSQHGRLSSDNVFLIRPPPPVGETRDERAARVKAEQDAAEHSRKIDATLLPTKQYLEKRKAAVKILLLGQSESGKVGSFVPGKSSLLLNPFMLEFRPETLPDGLHANQIQQRTKDMEKDHTTKPDTDEVDNPYTPRTGSTRSRPPTPISKDHRRLLLRLSPLLQVDDSLGQSISAQFLHKSPSLSPQQSQELLVRAGSNWKEELSLNLDGKRAPESLPQSDPTSLLHNLKDDVMLVWADPTIRQLLRNRHIRLEEMSGFFLDDTERIVASDYEPTDSDILRARVRTLGVEEHYFEVEQDIHKTGCKYFFVTDVAGHRSARASWVPFFDDAQAILFLAPLMYNLMLEEDPKVNRLEDSLLVWQDVCKNKLLANSRIILFLNKRDVLQKLLEDGVPVNKFVLTYGDTPNDIDSVTKYFKDRFHSYHRKLSPKERSFYCYETSAIDTRSMRKILLTVHDGIFKQSLGSAGLV